MTFYNDNDRHAAAWLRELARRGHISDGVVDERSIKDISGGDLDQHERVHFFAGIGGWDYALKLAGWPDDRPVWTGSCPCQPFSTAGSGGAESDERHLWPEFFRLIEECRPPTVFGEQVASKAGRAWLAGVRADLEQLGYAVGGADLCAAGVGAHHVRQRLWWVASADTDNQGPQGVRHATTGPWSLQLFAGLVQASLQTAIPTGKGRWLSDGLPARVVRLRGYGNAIVPQVAAEFIAAFMEAEKQ